MKNAHWVNDVDEEAAFWRSWFKEERFADARDERRAFLRSEFPIGFGRAVGAAPGELLRALDVGSGPISTLRTRAMENPVELVCTDALADVYNALLDEHGYDELPRVLKLKGEALSTQLKESSFHYVHIANALDHCEDPSRTLAEMYRVCRPAGLIEVVSVQNEGERQQYHGLHQWNLEADDAGLWLWRPSARQNLLEALGGHAHSWRYLDYLAEGGARVFQVSIRKARPSTVPT